jgi:hypothetical protein
VICCFPLPVQSFLVSGPFRAHDHIFAVSKTFMCYDLLVLSVCLSVCQSVCLSVCLCSKLLLALAYTVILGSGSFFCPVQVNCCRLSPAQSFLVVDPMGLMTLFFCLVDSGSCAATHTSRFWLACELQPLAAQLFFVLDPVGPMIHIFLSHTLGSSWLVGQMNCCWPSPAQLFQVLGPIRTHDQIFTCFKNTYMFENAVPSSTRGGAFLLSTHSSS